MTRKELKEYNDLVSEYNELYKENQELKKQLKNYKKLGFKHLQDKNNNLETQQKEFIEYLENEININPYDISDYDYEDIINTILSKYKEIIGDE